MPPAPPPTHSFHIVDAVLLPLGARDLATAAAPPPAVEAAASAEAAGPPCMALADLFATTPEFSAAVMLLKSATLLVRWPAAAGVEICHGPAAVRSEMA